MGRCTRRPRAGGVLAGLSPASATSTYTINLHQTPPITAAGYGEHEAQCASIPASQDGWHFVLPGNTTDFVKLTVTFQPGGQVVVTNFGPPTDKHAYVASAPGATLVSASAEVIGGEQRWFNLSHTCPATQTKPPTTPPPRNPHHEAADHGAAGHHQAADDPAGDRRHQDPAARRDPERHPVGLRVGDGLPDQQRLSASTGGSSGGGGGSLAQTGGIAVGGILAVSAAMVAGGYYIRRRAAGRQRGVLNAAPPTVEQHTGAPTTALKPSGLPGYTATA
ncbi:hypothetical protein ACU686_43515 [Yinghuangia aomiensis]